MFFIRFYFSRLFCQYNLEIMADKKSQKNAENYYCNKCNFECSKKSNFNYHNTTAKHKRLTNTDNNSPKLANNLNCEICEYICSRESDLSKHLLTAKHKRLTSAETIKKHFICDCGKSYMQRQSLFKHKKTCTYIEYTENKEGPNYKELLVEAMNQMKKKDEQVSEAMKQMKQKDEQVSEQMKKKDEQVSDAMNQMKEHQKQIIDMIPLIGNKTTNNNNNTTNNNKFNLNFFLNTQCKDAMSIQSFMENLSIGSKELEHMGDVGFLNGMIDIFNNTIGNMDIHKRPLHCTDKKREVLYFKQGDEWEKDSTDKQQLKKLIKDVETKNYYNVRDWSRAHKDSFTSETAAGDQYMKIATEALGGADSTKDSIYLSKIMKHIIREVTVKA